MIVVNQFRFEPGARTIIQMGEELIGHPTTAINELIKNGYDADATTASVYIYYDRDKEKSFLVISDNGLGMSKKTLFGNWLQPSVSEKRGENTRSKVLRRTFLGSKGIGRLAAMALGRYLTVISKTSEETSFSWLTIDRNDFKNDSLLSSVEFPGGEGKGSTSILMEPEVKKKKNGIFNPHLCEYIESQGLDLFPEGTVIVVEDLDDSICAIIEDEVINGDLTIENMSFVRALRILITPLYLNPKIQDELIRKSLLSARSELSLAESMFNVSFGSNFLPTELFPNSFLPIEEFEILDNFDYRLLGKVDGEGNINGIYNCNRLLEDSYETTFELAKTDVFSAESSRKRKSEFVDGTLNKNIVNSFLFDIRIFDRDTDAIERLSKVLRTSGRRETISTLDSIVGLRISKNGFGVKPYGEEDKDWMGLGEMRVQDPTAVLGVNQIIGNIFLYSPENDSLKEKTNREGFFENEAFIVFKKILRSLLKEAGQRRYNFRQKHGLGRRLNPMHEKVDSTRFFEFIKTLTKDESKISQAKKYLDDITTTLDNLENSLTFSQRLATLGSGLELVYHELAQPITIIGSSINLLRFPVSKISNEEVRDDLNMEVKQIRSANDLLSRLKASLEPAIGKAKKSIFKPVDTFNKVCYLFTREFIDENIRVEVSEGVGDLTLKDYEYFFWISFLNIVNNAVYWLKQEGDYEKVIYFKATNDSCIEISNTGPKIDDSELDNIFNYGVSFKKVKNATGLGLSFTRSILSANGWEIVAKNVQFGPAFQISKQKTDI